jgi:hypothetical protein
MVIEWREMEHEEVVAVVEIYVRDQQALKKCRLYTFWSIQGMRVQVMFLQTLINYWDSKTDAVNLDGKPLRFEVDDIYFIT